MGIFDSIMTKVQNYGSDVEKYKIEAERLTVEQLSNRFSFSMGARSTAYKVVFRDKIREFEDDTLLAFFTD